MVLFDVVQIQKHLFPFYILFNFVEMKLEIFRLTTIDIKYVIFVINIPFCLPSRCVIFLLDSSPTIKERSITIV